MGCRKNRYCSDMTRTFFCRAADPKYAAIHDLVREANELAESTYIDGASNWTAFFKVIFPLMKPMTATIVIINFLWIWNEFLIALVLLNKSQAMQTLTLYIYRFKGQYSSNFNLMFATVLMSIIPITIVYCALQKHIVAGLTGGAIKN